MLPYSYYIANLSQSGTGAPVATEAASNTITGIAWSRSAAGIYLGILANAFPIAKTFITSAGQGAGNPANVQVSRINDSTINYTQVLH